MKSTLALGAAAAFASVLSAQNLVLPDNHYLGESAIQAQSSGVTSWWGTTVGGRRMMVLYDASHFTGKAGVLGPVTFSKLSFRGEDTEKNTGGQTFTGVTVNVYKTTLNSTNMAANGSTTVFATNIVPSTGSSTLIATGSLPVLTVNPSVGLAPNNYMIDLPVAPLPSLFFDPLGDSLGEFNLLVDIAWTGYANGPAIAPSTTTITMIATQDTTAHGAGIRGRGIFATTPGAASGTASTAPPVMGVAFVGGGGYPNPVPARSEYYGAACGGSASTFYQLFAHDETFDLAGSGITMVPNTLGGYTVLPFAPTVDVTKVNTTPNSTADDVTLAATALGFTLTYPGGSTTTIRPCTNGYVWLDPVMSAADSSPTLLEWVGNVPLATVYTARMAPFWHDFHCGNNLVTHPGSGLHVVAVPETFLGAGDAECYVTWLNVGEFNTVTGGGQSVSTMQCVFKQAGNVVEFRYGAMSPITGGSVGNLVNGITGFTRGRIGAVNSVDPQSRDLSLELPVGPFPPAFNTGFEIAPNVSLTASSTPLAASTVYGARMFGGQALTWTVGNIPAAPLPIFSFLNLDLGFTRPGFQVPGVFTAPGCLVSTTLAPTILGWDQILIVLPTASVTGVALPIPHGWEGTDIYAQAIGVDLFSSGPLIAWSSNAIRYTVGLD